MDQQNGLDLNNPNESTGTEGPVTCLGQTFANDAERRAYFTELLRAKLLDPEFRKIEGFPIGRDEDILNLSDPPYYTACPNPWIADFISEWEAQKPEQAEGYQYHREPFAADVKEGKNDPIYNAHSYHTKVPHKAIMRYILHFTEPGDIVFDGFCGTGMTGVAAQMCGDREVVMSLGYQVKPDGTILQEEIDEGGKKVWKSFSKLGGRRAVLNDLSPAATFIAYNYNTPVNIVAFESEAKRILKEVDKECGWMYETKHTDDRVGKINYTVWSDVFVCPDCSGEVVFWDVAIDRKTGRVKEEFDCPNCSSKLTKKTMVRARSTVYSAPLGKTVIKGKQYPVLINYMLDGKRYEKKPDNFDLTLIEKVSQTTIDDFFPVTRIDRDIDLWYERDYTSIGVFSLDSFFTPRNLYALSTLRRLATSSTQSRRQLLFSLTGILQIASRMSGFRYDSRNPKNTAGGILKGALYIPSLSKEARITDLLSRKINGLMSAWRTPRRIESFATSTQSIITNNISDSSLDYLFFDPPFGSNIIYSDLSLPWEEWLKVSTNTATEAVVHRRKKRNPTTLDDYRGLMKLGFEQAFRVLKPGHWMTVEFSNTKASVWNSIQTALTEAGFIVANISGLDKKQGSFKAVTTPTAVKQDLVISAYKPNGGFEQRFLKEAQTEEGVWDFVQTHLRYLPVTKRQGALLQFVPERDPRILFDQMVSYYVRKGYPVPISSQEFQIGLSQRFIERDGMYFLSDQIEEYDRKKLAAGGVNETIEMFVKDEASMIQWLRQLIKGKPQTFSDINPQFMQQLGGWSKNEAQLDLRELLNQNFLNYDGKGPVPTQISNYLSKNWKEYRGIEDKSAPALMAKAQDRWYVPDPNKAGDLEKLREKALLKEFEEYRQRKGKFKRSEKFRSEALRAGFKKAWQDHDYTTIIGVAEKIPNKVLEEDPKLLMWYDQAVTRMGGE